MHVQLVRLILQFSWLKVVTAPNTVYLCNMGVAQLMQWGVPAALMLLHMHLLATNGLEDSQVTSSIFAISFSHCFLIFAFLRPMILLSFSLVKAKLALHCARPVPKTNNFNYCDIQKHWPYRIILPRQDLLGCKWTKT